MSPRGAFSYLRRVVERSSGLEFAAKFIPSQAKPKASARREARLLARLQHDCVLYFHEAFERRRGLVIVTELYPETDWGMEGTHKMTGPCNSQLVAIFLLFTKWSC
jgi:serine/threonine protein kinase